MLLTTGMLFQSPRSGKFVSDNGNAIGNTAIAVTRFQSPRSGKFVSNINMRGLPQCLEVSFNPLDRGNLYLM